MRCRCRTRKEDKRVAVINSSSYVEWFNNTNYRQWQPTPEEMTAIDAVVKKVVKDGKFSFIKRASLKKVKERYRQYLCYYTAFQIKNMILTCASWRGIMPG